MKISNNLGKLTLWLAWTMFLVSLFLPMERHNVAGPCAWPCLYPFFYTVGSNSLIFLFSPLLLVFNLIGILLTGDGFETIWLYIVYSAIGIGEILLFLSPFLANKVKSQSLRRFIAMLLVSVLAIVLYALIPDLRYGIDPLLRGYYIFLLSFLMMILALILNLKKV